MSEVCYTQEEVCEFTPDGRLCDEVRMKIDKIFEEQMTKLARKIDEYAKEKGLNIS